MCGIAGISSAGSGARVEEAEILRLRDAQEHRGPDDAGLWLASDASAGLGHRRLSIIDLSPLGHQPMASDDGRWQLVFNGEIYNFRALRRELEERGRRFKSQSDSEVVLIGFQEWGTDLFDRLRGMFALAIHDAHTRETVLARDPLGIKPLYTYEDGKRVAFASEVQALRTLGDGGGIDAEALARYLLWGSIPAPRTLYKRIRSLPAGCWARIGAHGLETPRAYFRLEQVFGASPNAGMDAREAAEAARSALVDSAQAHLVADVPVGAFLSGGVDSSALVGFFSEAKAEGDAARASMRTVTLSFSDRPELDEGALAREAALLYGSDHREIPIRVEDIRERMPDAIRALDQPSVDGVNSYFVSEAAVRAGLKVAVSGVGGDELFGGYSTFTRVPQIQRWRARLGWLPGVAPAGAALFEALPSHRQSARLTNALRSGATHSGAYLAERALFSPQEIRALLVPELAGAADGALDELDGRLDCASLPPAERVSALEFRQYLQCQLLRDTDAVSMRHSLEVRTPLVDRVLLESLCRIPAEHRMSGPAKRLLREAPRPPVPEALWNRKKQGFTLPFDHWLKSGGIGLRRARHDWLRADTQAALETGFRAGRVHFSRVWALHVLGEFL